MNQLRVVHTQMGTVMRVTLEEPIADISVLGNGQAGDNASLTHAVLLRFKGCLMSKNISTEMKVYVKNNSTCH